MRQRGYLVLFIFVLLLACAGGFLGGRFLIRRWQQDFRPRDAWTPPPAAQVTVLPNTPTSAPADLPAPSPTAAKVTATASVATATPLPPEDSSAMPPPEPTPLEPEPTATETPAPTAAPVSAFLFDLARPVRHSAGDCPGSYVLGRVTDAAGNALPDVRLRLVDEYGNEQAAATKSGGEAGRYDFPIFGPPRRFYLSVVDAGGQPLSPRIEILHGLGAQPEATCHWADWRRR